MTQKTKEIYLAGGCFWGVENYMARIDGVKKVVVGYANGKTANPTYEQVCRTDTGYAEAVHIVYDESIVDLQTLLIYFFRVIDPTSLNKQGGDMGTQYRTGIYYTDKADIPMIEEMLITEQTKYKQQIVVEIQGLENFYLAEEYHQKYLVKNPNGYCHIDISKLYEPIEKIIK